MVSYPAIATRSDRTRSRGALLQDLRPAILRPSVAGLLSRKMERRRVRSLLDADADWADVELWPIAPNNWPGTRTSHSDGFCFVRAATALPARPLSGAAAFTIAVAPLVRTYGFAGTNGLLCGQDIEGCEPGQSSSRAACQIRVDDQLENRKGAWVRHFI